MSILRLTEAPLKIPIAYQSDLTLERVWLQYIGTLADSVTGYWGRQEGAFTITGITLGVDDTNVLIVQANIVSINLNFKGLTSVNAEVSLPEDYEVIDGFVSMIEVNNLGSIIGINQLYVEDSTFKIPDLAVSNTVIISGNLIRRS